ncbi:hypothetical protein [Sinomonas sp. ASV322]|uniref:hypothetical protein n=1 Tax=Sinomonas sp. ASV322 TaxID=3041920 RepID=UPI0027DBD11B|nr:hypothetical protein [Sinomonas sp. ASV322]MDQ4500706.1 hypothetical protein [Sinomonas sp. ASV322]
MGSAKQKSPRRYWIELSAAFAVALDVSVVMPGLALMAAMLLGLVVATFIHAVYYGQIGRHIQGKFATATPGMGLTGMPFAAAALLLRGTEIAYWAGPLLAAAGFVVMFLFLDRFGKFYPTSSRDPA